MPVRHCTNPLGVEYLLSVSTRDQAYLIGTQFLAKKSLDCFYPSKIHRRHTLDVVVQSRAAQENMLPTLKENLLELCSTFVYGVVVLFQQA